MEIKSLGNTPFSTLFQAFGQAFADYEMQLDSLQLQTMLRRRGYLPALSFGAFEGEELVAFTLNGIGEYGGIPTAYDTGTGTIAACRGQGLATKIFEYSLPYLREAGIRQYLLEVLQHNAKAISVYRKLGFEVSRQFNYFIQENHEVRTETVHQAASYLIKEIDAALCQSASGFCDFLPSWQNSFDSIRRTKDDFLCFGAFVENRLAGYCIFEPVSGDVTQLAVASQYRRRGIGTSLLREAMRRNKHTAIKVINTDTTCTGMTGFLRTMNIEPKGKQFEMLKTLDVGSNP